MKAQRFNWEQVHATVQCHDKWTPRRIRKFMGDTKTWKVSELLEFAVPTRDILWVIYQLTDKYDCLPPELIRHAFEEFIEAEDPENNYRETKEHLSWMMEDLWGRAYKLGVDDTDSIEGHTIRDYLWIQLKKAGL